MSIIQDNINHFNNNTFVTIVVSNSNPLVSELEIIQGIFIEKTNDNKLVINQITDFDKFFVNSDKTFVKRREISISNIYSSEHTIPKFVLKAN